MRNRIAAAAAAGILTIGMAALPSAASASEVAPSTDGLAGSTAISPKKTVAGFVGGLFGGMLVAVVMFLLFEQFALFPNAGYIPFTDATWKSALIYLVIGLVGALAGQLGDLAASRIKRALGVKDFGKIFPGHGGVMDRFDSIMFGIVTLLVAFTVIYA